MLLVALFIGVILIVAAVRNSQGALFSALMQDVPDFVVWAAAIIALGAVGYVPGLKPVSRGLLMLVITVIVLRNYKNVIGGFQSAWQSPPPAATTVDTVVVPGGVNDNSIVTAPSESTFSGTGVPSSIFHQFDNLPLGSIATPPLPSIGTGAAGLPLSQWPVQVGGS